MNDTPHLWPAEAPRRAEKLATLRYIFATWEARKRFRGELERMTKANPHLIADIGLTRHQAEAEIAKPFWQE
ncbi:hypothetical protein DM872_08900 [Pseudomonas taiwanensis]|uniref:DUF1127 domain-containing protein n=1 Tax=Pseudomonas taiwanensis TaxID=470150 RepID=UPI0015BD58FD|nr:DUF1127 domain-containing protein [Pseudomonas taiwanensis]NWL76967.1 hypothetical protein [Pseudomonas taiwanensis]